MDFVRILFEPSDAKDVELLPQYLCSPERGGRKDGPLLLQYPCRRSGKPIGNLGFQSAGVQIASGDRRSPYRNALTFDRSEATDASYANCSAARSSPRIHFETREARVERNSNWCWLTWTPQRVCQKGLPQIASSQGLVSRYSSIPGASAHWCAGLQSRALYYPTSIPSPRQTDTD